MAEDFEDLKTVIAKILLNLTMLNIAENVTFNHLLNNCLLLLDHGCYLSLYILCTLIMQIVLTMS